MEIRLIQSFVTLAGVGNYRLAAEMLFMTQPALTKQIQTLEKIVDNKLFIRGRNGAKLTMAGEALYPEAQKLLEKYQRFSKLVGNIKKTPENLSIGFGISSFKTVPKWIRAFSKKYPNSRVTTRQMFSSEQITLLIRGELDIGFLRMPKPDSLHHSLNSISLSKEYIALAVPDEVDTNSTKINDLFAMYPLLHIKADLAPCLTEQIKLLLTHIKVDPKEGTTTNDLPSLLALVAGNNGIAFVPASVCHFLPKGVKLINLELEKTGWEISVVWNATIENNKRDLFLKIIKKSIQYE